MRRAYSFAAALAFVAVSAGCAPCECDRQRAVDDFMLRPSWEDRGIAIRVDSVGVYAQGMAQPFTVYDSGPVRKAKSGMVLLRFQEQK